MGLQCISAPENCYLHVQFLFYLMDFHFWMTSSTYLCVKGKCTPAYILPSDGNMKHASWNERSYLTLVVQELFLLHFFCKSSIIWQNVSLTMQIINININILMTWLIHTTCFILWLNFIFSLPLVHHHLLSTFATELSNNGVNHETGQHLRNMLFLNSTMEVLLQEMGYHNRYSD